MKTSVEIDPSKLAKAKGMVDAKTLRELIDRALDALISQSRRQSLSKFLGTDFFEGNLNRMRKRRGRRSR